MPQITVNTGMDTKPVWNGIKDMNSALRSLRSYVSRAGKEMNASVVGYARAMRANADASREVDARVQELNQSYQELVRQIDELGNAKIDTKEYADLKKEIEAAQKGLQRLLDAQGKLKDLGRDTTPTKEFKDNQAQLKSLYRKRIKLDEDYNNASKQMTSANDVYQNKLKQLNSEIARKNQLINRRDAAYANKDFRSVNELDKQISASSKSIAQYRKELSSAEKSVDKYAEKMGMIEEKAIQTGEAISSVEAEQTRLKNTGGDIQDSEAMRKSKYEAQKLTQELAKLQQQKQDMEKAGTAFIDGKETEQYGEVVKKAAETERELQETIQQGQKDTRPIYIKEWEQMATITHTVSEGFARLVNAAQIAGHAITHPFEALNRLIPVVLSGLAQLAQKALNVAVSFAKWAIHSIVDGVQRLARAALSAAAGLARMVGSAVVSFLQRLATAAKNAAVQLARVAGKAVVTGLKGIASVAAQAGKAILGIGRSAKRSNNGLGQAVKMLVKYGFGVRSVFILVRRLRSALVDAFKNMAQKVPEVNKAISSLAASLGMLKNSMATAFQPILNAIAPMLTQLMDMLSEAMVRVGMFFAALTGQDYVYRATKANYDYAKSLDKTKKSAKEAENQLASFDELNILKAPNDSSSGAGDTNAADAGAFIKTPLESSIKEFVDTIKKMLKSGEFAELGELLGDKINEFVNSIDWSGYAVKIGGLVNGLLKFYNAFMEDINWQNIGTKIAEAINGLVDTIDWEALGRAFSQRINAIFGILAGLVDRINAADLGQAMSDALWGFFGNIHWEEIGSTIGTGLTKIADSVTEFATNFPWEDFATEVANGANELFSKITPTKIGGMLVGIIHDGFKFLLNFLRFFKFEEHGQALQKGIKTFVEGIDADLIGETLKTAMIRVLGYIKEAFGDENTWRTAGSKLAFALNRLFGTHQAGGATVWTHLADAIVTYARDVIAALTGFVSDFEWGQAGRDFHDAVLKLIEDFPAGELGRLMTTALKGIIDTFGPTLKDPKVWREAGVQFSEALNAFFGKKPLWEEAGKTVNGMLNNLLTFGQTFLGSFKAETAATNIKTALGQIKWGEIATNVWETAKIAFKKAGDFLNVLFGEDVVKAKTHRIPVGLSGQNIAVTDDLSKTISKHVEVDNSSLGYKIGAQLSKLIASINWEQFGNEFGTAANNIFSNIADFFNKLIDDGTVTTAVKAFFGGLPNSLASDAVSAASRFLKVLADAIMKEFASMLKDDQATEAVLKAQGQLLDDVRKKIGDEKLNEIRVDLRTAGINLDNVEEKKEELEDIFKKYEYLNIDTTHWSVIIDADNFESKMNAIWDDFQEDAESEYKEAASAGANSYIKETEKHAQDVQQTTEKVFLPSQEKLLPKASQVSAALVSELTSAFKMMDAAEYANFTVDDYFHAFEARFAENGVIKEECAAAVDEILGAGATAAYNNGDMTPQYFWNAWQEHMRDRQPETAAALNDAVSDTFNVSDTAEQSGTDTTYTWFSALIQATLDKQGEAEGAVDKAFNEIWGVIDPDGNGEIAAWGYMQTFISTVEDAEGNVKSDFKDVIERCFGSVDSYNEAKKDGKDFMKGIVNGMSGEENSTKKKLVSVIDNVLSYLATSKSGFEEHSPSKRAAGYGENFMKGFVQGTKSEESGTKTSTVGVFTSIFAGIVASAAALTLLNAAVSLAMTTMSTTISTTLTTVSTNFTTTWANIRTKVATTASQMATNVTTSMRTIVSTVQQGMNSVYSTINNSSNNMSRAMGNAMSSMQRAVSSGMNSIRNTIYSGMSSLASAANSVNWWSIGDQIVAGIQRGVISNWRWLTYTVRNLAMSLFNSVRNILGIHSPSTLFRDGVGAMIGLGIAEGVEDTEAVAVKSIASVADAMTDKMNGSDMRFNIGTENALSDFSDKIADSFTTLLDRLQSIADSVAFRTPDIAAGTVMPYNVAAQTGNGSAGLVEALEVSNDDLANVVIQATNNAAVAIVDAIQRHTGGVFGSDISTQTSRVIDEINRRARANGGVSPLII